jgi:acetyl-CoA acyltransferase
MDAYLVDGVRTPIGNLGGTLSPIRADDLAALSIKGLMKKFPQLEGSSIDDVLLGCANQAGEDNRNVARMATLLAGLPASVPGETINRLCASGMAAAVNASRLLHMGDAQLVIAGGVEHMTRGPWVISKASKPFGRDSQMHDTSFGWRFVNPQLDELYGTESMGQTAENLVDLYGISRVDQDAFACWSQEKAAARDSFRAEEIIQVSIPRRKQESLIFEKDEFVRANTTKAVLAKLRPAFRDKNGTVTAGNASGLNDGSAALLMASAGGLEAHGLDPLAQVVSSAVVGVEPRVMGIGPVRASNLALERAGLTMADMDLIELNEAFSAQALACIREWGLDDRDPRINPQGGAIALGHPLGMTGARLLLTAAKQLRRTEKKFALVTLCIGVGQGYATILQNPRLGA